MISSVAQAQRSGAMSDIPNWHIVGDWFDNCSCAVACPCTFAQAPDNGFCESVLFWRVREGHYGDVKLDNLSFVRVGRWEGDLCGRQARGVERAKIAFEIAPDQAHWGVEIVGKLKAWAKALTGPTSNPGSYPRLMNAPGSETGPGPQLVTWGKSTILSVDAYGFKFEYTSNSAKHIPFDWTGPAPYRPAVTA